MTTSDPLAGFLTGPNPGLPLVIAENYLAANGSPFGISSGDIGRLFVTNQYADSATGITHIYLTQGFDGIKVENANVSIRIGAKGEVIFVGGDFVNGLGASPSAASPPAPSISASQAILAAASQLNLTATGPLLPMGDLSGVSQAGTFTLPGVSVQAIPVHLDFVNTGQGVREAWAVNFKTPVQPQFHWYDIRVDAITGQIIDKNDWVMHVSDGSSYNVYPLAGTNPSDATRTLLGDPSDPGASPYGWLDTNGKPGADTTETNGNNVNAYQDPNGTGTGVGPRPDGGKSHIFNFPIDLNQDPTTYADAATTNLFYLDNAAHDILYKYGFDEAAGNFQLNDYNRGGVGGDPVIAANEYGANVGQFNNSFMATPPDGQSPLQAMFLFNQHLDGSPLSPRRDGSLDATVAIHELSHGTSGRLTGGPSLANGLQNIQSGGMNEGWSDWYAMMFTQLATDGESTPRGIANYAFGQPDTGGGIRTFPYAYDLSIDPRTIGEFGNSNGKNPGSPSGEVHDTGEMWAATLWDMNMILRQKYGFNPNLADGFNPQSPAGNTLAFQLVLEGEKLQPANPSFSDGRNAILAADQALTGGQNQYEIWSAFARRGIGFSFRDGGGSKSLTVTEAFDIPKQVFVEAIPTISTTEDASLDGLKLAEFFDGTPGPQTAGNYTIAINWGDGTTPTTGLVSVNARGGFDLFAVGKSYFEGGNYTVTLAVNNKLSGAKGSSNVDAQVSDFPLVASAAADIASTEGATKKFTFGSFGDKHLAIENASSYKVNVDWGDGSAGTGVVVPVAGQPNNFTVQATNAFSRFGTYPYTATVTDKGGSIATFSGNVASVIDTNRFGLLSDLSASISWGDGHVTPGLVQRDPLRTTGFLVSGSNKYARFGLYNYTINVTSLGGSSLAITGSVTVADAPLSSQGTFFSLVEGQTFSGLVATLRDANPTATTADFTGTIDWGDKTPITNAQFTSGGGGGFLVKGTHKFNEQGNFTVVVSLKDVGGQSTSTTTAATIAAAPLNANTTGLGPLTIVEGKTFSGVVANFIDGNPTKPLGDFTVGINWGDGTLLDAGTVTQLPSGLYQVVGTHTYSDFGNDTITTTITDNAAVATTASIPITVSDAAITASGFDSLFGKEGFAFTDPVATFSDANPTPRLGDFSATINWGDNTSSQGVISFAVPFDGTFVVTGNHIYDSRPTPYVVGVIINDAGGSTQTVSSHLTIPNGTLTAKVVPINPVPSEGVRFNALLATFTDTNPNPKPGEFSAKIFWGDGTSSAAFILPDQSVFDVRGSHLYLAGDYNVDIYITEAGGGQAEAHSSITVNTATITPTGLTKLAGVEGVVYSDPIATFSSANPLALATGFTATVNWGDNTPDEFATITPSTVAGSFVVSGAHTFHVGQNHPINITVQANGGVNYSIASAINVADAPLVATGVRVTAGVGSAGSYYLGTVDDAAGKFSAATDLTATINWGDGTPGTVGQLVAVPSIPSKFTLYGEHAYLIAGSFSLQATITDVGGSTASLSSLVTINTAALFATFAPFEVQEKTPFSSSVAHFVSQNSLAIASNFAATVNWGDGSSSPGIVTRTGGGFDVAGSHTYATSGNFPVSVGITSNENVTTFAQGNATVDDRLIPIVGGVVSSGNGGSLAGGASNANQPTFRGTAELSDIVTLTAIRAGVGTPILIGTVQSGADGTWSITTVPLLDGTYTVTANAADAAGRPSTFPVTFSTLVIDTVAPRITGVSLNPKLGKVFVTFQDDRSGLIDAELSNLGNYALSLPGKGLIPITGITVSPGSGSDPRLVTLDVALGSAGKRHGARAARYTLSIAGHNFTDAAGNALSEQFFLSTTTAPKSGYIAQLVSDGRAIASPQLVQATSTPKPSKFRHHR